MKKLCFIVFGMLLIGMLAGCRKETSDDAAKGNNISSLTDEVKEKGTTLPKSLKLLWRYRQIRL